VRDAALQLLGGAPSHVPLPAPSTKATPDGSVSAAPILQGALPDESLLLQTIQRLGRDPRLGGFVSIADLRHALDGQVSAADQFDESLWRLAQARRVDLYPHDYPGSLTNEERRQLLVDDHGRCFNGVSLRQPESF
jgi:hypothetical protein